MGKQVYIKIDPFMVSKLFKDHPNLFYTKNGLLVDLSTEQDFKNYVTQSSLTPYMIVDEDEAIRNRYPIMDNPEHPNSVRIGQDPLRLIVYDNYIRNLMNLYPNIKSEADARALHAVLTRYNQNVNDFYNYNYKRGANDTADDLWNSLVADLRFILEKMGKNPADADAVVRQTLAGFDDAIADAITNDITDKTLPEGYTIGRRVVPYYDGYAGATTVYDHMKRPIILKNLGHPDPINNGANNAIFNILSLGAGVANMGARNLGSQAYNLGQKATLSFFKYSTPSTWIKAVATNGFKASSETANMLGLWGDNLALSTLGGLAVDNFVKNPNFENGVYATLGVLPYSFMLSLPILNSRPILNLRLSNALNNSIKVGDLEYPANKPTVAIPTKPISAAERLGIPKGERNLLTLDLNLALEDLYLYIINSRHRRIPYWSQDLNKIIWNHRDPHGTTLFKALATRGAAMRYDWFRFKTSMNNLNGYLHYNPTTLQLLYRSNAFPEVEGLSWKPGIASVHGKGRNQSLILTPPKIDANIDIANLLSSANPADKALGQRLSTELPVTISKETMKDFWGGVSMSQRPGTYLSGDAGTYPLGDDLIDSYIANRSTGIYPNLTSKNTPRYTRAGLSPDSYSSIIRQALRPGNELRWGEGFTNWNNTAVANKHIFDAWEDFNSGKINIWQYKSIFDSWAKQIGGRPLQLKIINNKLLPVHPHPFIFKKAKGGRMYK